MSDVAVSESIQQALADGSWGQYDARWTAQLIRQLSETFQCEHVLLCSSGTVAVEIALRGLGIAAESEVVLAGYDFPGNFRAIEAVGAQPVLVDVVENGWVMDPAELQAAITPRTSAVVVSHLHGQIADVSQIRSICDENRLRFVEDVCQMPGGSIGNRPFCTFGDVAVLSFGGSKLLTAGRGGAVLTNAAEVYQRAKIFGNRGNEVYPLSQLQAAAILPQLKTLDARNEQRLVSTRLLIENTSNTTILSPLQQVIEDENLKPVFYKLPWLIDDVRSHWTRSEFVAAVQAEGVAIDVGFRGFTRRSP
jgi:dTDP-4-amino-4,6-dideoxygalactose transaminase